MNWISPLFALLLAIVPTIAAEPVRITRDRADEISPFWNPAGEQISFSTNREPGRVRAIGLVNADGSAERVLATGMQDGFGIVGGARTVWAGTSGKIVTAESSNFHEYLEFEVGEGLLERSVLDGDDDLFKVVLKVDGGGGSHFLDISRDGSTAVWRYSTIGGIGEVSLRVAPYAGLGGGDASSVGRQVARWETSSESDVIRSGGGIGPKGKVFVGSDSSGAGTDLFLYDLEASGDPEQLTFSGQEKGSKNGQPCVSPDGQWVAFNTSSLYASTQGGRIVLAKGDLCLLRIADRRVFMLTETEDLSEGSPSWAPDGRRLAFARLDTREAGTVDPGEPDNANLYVLTIPEEIFRTPVGETDK